MWKTAECGKKVNTAQIVWLKKVIVDSHPKPDKPHLTGSSALAIRRYEAALDSYRPALKRWEEVNEKKEVWKAKLSTKELCYFTEDPCKKSEQFKQTLQANSISESTHF